MMLWLVLAIILLCSGLFLAAPFLRSLPVGPRRSSRLAALKDLLGDINRAEAMNEIDGNAADAERTGIQRQILESSPPEPDRATPRPRTGGLTAVAVLAVIVLGAVALYAVTAGVAPGDGDMSASVTPPVTPPAKKMLPDVDTMITRLADRMKKTPSDVEGWRMLGWSWFETRHYPESVSAYSHAVALQPRSAPLQSTYGEALTSAAGGKVTADALRAFRAALAAEPKDERARYYVALAQKQTGDARGALEAWIAGLKEAPPASLWSARLRSQIVATAGELNVDVSTRLPAAPPVPASDFASLATKNSQQIASLSPEEQQSMIAGMVEGLDRRLTQNPKDAEGWVRLIRSRKVLGQMDLAKAALGRALASFADDPQTQTRIKNAALGLGVTLN